MHYCAVSTNFDSLGIIYWGFVWSFLGNRGEFWLLDHALKECTNLFFNHLLKILDVVFCFRSFNQNLKYKWLKLLVWLSDVKLRSYGMTYQLCLATLTRFGMPQVLGLMCNLCYDTRSELKILIFFVFLLRVKW